LFGRAIGKAKLESADFEPGRFDSQVQFHCGGTSAVADAQPPHEVMRSFQRI
jgi:hypothetical protein